MKNATFAVEFVTTEAIAKKKANGDTGGNFFFNLRVISTVDASHWLCSIDLQNRVGAQPQTLGEIPRSGFACTKEGTVFEVMARIQDTESKSFCVLLKLLALQHPAVG